MKKVLLPFFCIVTVAVAIILIIFFKPIGQKVNTTTQTTTTTITPTEAKRYSISFDSDGGSDVSSQTVNEGDKINKPSDPTKEGNTFLGWYLDDSLINLDTYKVNKDISLKAKWSLNSYTVRIVYEGAYENTFEFQREYGLPFGSSIEGLDLTYTPFLGWYVDGEYVSDDLSISMNMPAKDVEIKGLFDKIDINVEVIIYGDGTGTVTGAGTYKYEDKVYLTAVADDGSYFLGWNNRPEIYGYGRNWDYYIYAYNPNGEKVYAVFIKEDRPYAIEHYIQKLDGSYEIYQTGNGSVKLFEMTNTQPLEIEGFTPKEIEEQKMKEYSDITIKVYYDRNEYDLSLLVNDESLGSVSGKEKYKYGEEVYLTVNPAIGYVFDGWYIGEDLVSPNPNYRGTMPSSDLELTAVFVIDENIEYNVNHLLRLDDGTYELIESETLTGTYLEMTQAVAKTYDNYTVYPFNQKEIDPRKSLAVNICYEKNKYDLRVSASDSYDLVIGKQESICSRVRSIIYNYMRDRNGVGMYNGDVRLNSNSSGKIYNWYFGVSKTYEEWQAFYDNPTEILDYPYFVDENGFYNPTFYISSQGGGSTFYYSIVDDPDSLAGRVHTYICNYLYENYFDISNCRYHFSTADGEFYIGSTLFEHVRLYDIIDDVLGEISFKVKLRGVILGEITEYDEFGAASKYSTSSKIYTLDIKMSYDEFYERFITTSDISYYYYVEDEESYSVFKNTDYGRINKEKDYYEYNEDVTLTAIPSEGYEFVGWYENDVLLSDSLEYSFKMKNYDMFIRAIFKPVESLMYKREDNVIYFGSYPQTKVDDNALISYLGGYIDDVPTLEELNGWTLFDYSSRVEGNNYDTMFYYNLDLNNDGMNDYMAVIGIAQNQNNILYSKTLWYKYEPIKWYVLEEDDGKAMIISSIIIDCHQFNSRGNTSAYEHNGGEGYCNNYELSDIRLWLNSTFYDRAFNDFEKELIQATEVDNSKETTNNAKDIYICDNTLDNVFLLSYSEVMEYYPTVSSRIIGGTDYSQIHGETIANNGGGVWVLRSPGDSASNVTTVSYQGNVAGVSKASSGSHGIRPVIWIEL